MACPGGALENTIDNNTKLQTITDPAAQRKLTLLLSTVIFFSVLNGTMFNVSLPDIAKQFSLLPSQVSWVVSGYIIVFAIGSVTYGRLADAYSVRNLITIGLVLFSAGSLIGFLSQWYPLLIAARVVQAAGSGAIPALAMLIATRYFPAEIRGRVLGIIASTVAFGGGIGPVLGGFITGTFHWRYLFILSVMTLFTIPSFRRHLPGQARHDGGFDILGALLLAGTVGALLLFITLSLWWLLAVSSVFLAWFVAHIRRRPSPFVSPALFRDHRYRNTIIIAFLSVSTIFGMMFMTPLMLRGVNELGTGRIGLVMFPGAMGGAILGTIGGKLVDKKGSIPVVYTGLALLISGFFFLSTVAGLSPWIIALNLIICYGGFAFLQSSLAHTVSSTLPKEHLGIGMGMYNLFFFMSGAFSAALIGKLLDLSKGHSPANPLTVTRSAGPYSNLFLLLAGIVLAAVCIFYFTFRGQAKKRPP